MGNVHCARSFDSVPFFMHFSTASWTEQNNTEYNQQNITDISGKTDQNVLKRQAASTVDWES